MQHPQAPSSPSSLVLEMRIRDYSDIDKMEREISRLLHCDPGRIPVHTTTVPYFRFRSQLIRMLHHLQSDENVAAEAKAYLPQGLRVHCTWEDTSKMAGAVVARIVWMGSVIGSTTPTAKEIEEGCNDAVNNDCPSSLESSGSAAKKQKKRRCKI